MLATNDPDLPGSVVHNTIGFYLIGWRDRRGRGGPERADVDSALVFPKIRLATKF